MARGSAADVGATRIAQNGYHYTKVEDRSTVHESLVGPGWALTHHITASQKLGRPLTEGEIVKFVEPKFKRDPYNLAGIKIIKKRTSSYRRRLAAIDARIEELQAERKFILDQLEGL